MRKRGSVYSHDQPGPGLRATRAPPVRHRPCHGKGGCMRTIGLDLAVQTAHKAVVLDEQGHFCTSILTVHTRPSELDQLLARARDGASSTEVQIVMEPTGMAWFPIAVYSARQAVPVYLVDSPEVADLRRYEHAP